MHSELAGIDITKDPRWAEFMNRGYSLRERDGDTAVALYYKDAYITDFIQTKVDINEVLNEARAHWSQITAPAGVAR